MMALLGLSRHSLDISNLIFSWFNQQYPHSFSYEKDMSSGPDQRKAGVILLSAKRPQ